MSRQPDPSHIFQVGMGFQASKTLLAAVGFDLFTMLGRGPLTGEEIRQQLGLHPRGIWDFLDSLVALGLLDRDGDGAAGRYQNTLDTATFLDSTSPSYIGGFLDMNNNRGFRYWADLEEGLRTAEPQAEVKHTGVSFFDEFYSDPIKLEQFMRLMEGLSLGSFQSLAKKFDFSKYRTLCDVGGGTAQLGVLVAQSHPEIKCMSFDLPDVRPIADQTIAAAGLTDRISTVPGDFFVDALPRADVVTMGHVLHDWGLDKKMQLIKAAYQAIPDDGAFIVTEEFIDDARRENVPALMMSLTMMLEFGEAFDFSVADLREWCLEVGFARVEALPLDGSGGAAVAYKT